MIIMLLELCYWGDAIGGGTALCFSDLLLESYARWRQCFMYLVLTESSAVNKDYMYLGGGGYYKN